MTIKPILGHHKKSDGKCQVKIYIYANGKKSLEPTEFYVSPSDWDKGRVKKGKPNADRINYELNLKVLELERTWLENREASPIEIRRGDVTLFGFIDQYILDIRSGKVLNKGQRFNLNTVKNYVTSTKYLKKFNPKLDWKDINSKFYDDYMNFLRQSYGENTIAKAVKVLKSIMKRGSKHHNNNEYINFSASFKEVDTIALTEKEIENIISCKVEKHLEAERDRFYLSYNLLLRFGDSVSLSEDDVFKRGGRHFVTMIHEKTKNKVIIPLFPKSIEILKKYKYKLPPTTNQESNWKLKEIGKQAGVEELVPGIVKGKSGKWPKYHFITTHTARRSMATNLYLNGFDLKDIQLMGGWRSMAVLEKYLKIDKLQSALKAADHPFFN